MTRALVILVNTSSDAKNLTEQDCRYTGERELHAFSMGMGTNLPAGADSRIINQGLTVALESRVACRNS